jgi:large subunit ribosomal protein L19
MLKYRLGSDEEMQSLIDSIESKYRKPQVVDVKSGDIVRVHQKITEGDKSRVQVFEGLVIRTAKKNSLLSTIVVRRIASGVGVEKTFLLHSPLIEKVEVIKRSKVRRNNLSYMRTRSGKSARLLGMDFDKEAVNTIDEQIAEAEVVPGEPEETKMDDAAKPEDTKEEPAESEKTEAKAEDKPGTMAEDKEAKKPEASKQDSKESK